jgi:hypothetical protein
MRSMSNKLPEPMGTMESPEPDEHISPDRQAVLQARRDARAAIPTTYVDTWATLIWKGHIRIVLGEWLNKNPQYRAAYVMELEDAKSFAETLLKRIKEQQEEDTSEARVQAPDSGA